MGQQLNGWMAEHGIGAGALIGTVVALVVGIAGSMLLHRGLRAVVRRWTRSPLPYGTIVVIGRTLTGVLWLCVGLLILNAWGVGASGVWTFLVSITTLIGVGFLATWTMVSNVTASFFLTVWRPFHRDDDVELLPESLKGRVVERNLMFTVLEEERGTRLQVPNNLFFQKAFRVREIHEQYNMFEFPNHRRPPASEPTTRAPAPARS